LGVFLTILDLRDRGTQVGLLRVIALCTCETVFLGLVLSTEVNGFHGVDEALTVGTEEVAFFTHFTFENTMRFFAIGNEDDLTLVEIDWIPDVKGFLNSVVQES
jgi:hypothetical protein